MFKVLTILTLLLLLTGCYDSHSYLYWWTFNSGENTRSIEVKYSDTLSFFLDPVTFPLIIEATCTYEDSITRLWRTELKREDLVDTLFVTSLGDGGRWPIPFHTNKLFFYSKVYVLPFDFKEFIDSLHNETVDEPAVYFKD